MENTSREHRPRRILIFSATLFAVVLLVYAAFLIAPSWQDAESGPASQLSTIAALDENAIDIYFTQLKIGMQNLGADLLDMQRKPDLDRAFSLVRQFQSLHTELASVMLIRSDGQILLTGTTPNRPDMPSLANDAEFRKIRDKLRRDSPFAIGLPITGHIDKSWFVPVRYAVTDRAGKLVYVISANLPTDMLQRFWKESISPGITGLGLVHDDGYLLGHYPEPDADSLNEMYGKPIWGAMAEYLRANNHPQQGQIEIRSSDGKKTALLVLRRLQHYPVTLFFEMPVTEIRNAWWHDKHAPYLPMVLLLAFAFGIYGLRHRRHVWSMEKRREELRHHYEHALIKRSPNEIFMLDTDTLQFTYANDYALNNLGYTLEQLQKKNMLSLHPESGVESFEAMIDRLHRGEQESVTYQTVQVRKDESAYPVEVNLQLITSEDGVERLLAIIHDITALKQAEENIRKFNAPVERRVARERKNDRQ